MNIENKMMILNLLFKQEYKLYFDDSEKCQ